MSADPVPSPPNPPQRPSVPAMDARLGVTVTGDATAYLAPRPFQDGDDAPVPGWGVYARGDCIGVGPSEAEALLGALANARRGVLTRPGPRNRAAEMIEDLRKLPPDAVIYCWDSSINVGSDVIGVVSITETDLRREMFIGYADGGTSPIGIVCH